MNLGTSSRIYLLSATHAANSVYNRVLTTVFPLIMADFGLSYSQVGLIASAYAAGNSLFQFPISFAADYTGRRRTVLIFSLVLNALPVLLYGWVPGYSLLLLLVFLSGIGSSAYHPSAVALVAEESPERRGFAMGIFKAGGDFGSVITPAAVGWLAVSLASWRTAAQIFVFPGLIAGFLVWMYLRDTPVERGPIRQEAKSTIWALLRNRAMIAMLLLSSCRVMVLRGFITFIPLLLVEKFGYTTSGVGWILTVYFIFGTGSSVVLGKLSDRFKYTTFIVGTMSVGTLVLALLPFAEAVWALFPLLFIMATTLGPSQGPILAVMTEMIDEKSRASSVGLLYTVNEVAATVSPFVGGLIAQQVGLQRSFFFYSALTLLATSLSVLIHLIRERQQLRAG